MDEKRTSRLVGILFLVALFMNLIGVAIYQPITGGVDYLLEAGPRKAMVLTGVLIDLVSVPAIILIPIVFFPILERFNFYLAEAYVVFRAIEAVFFIQNAINSLSIINLSQQHLASGAAASTPFTVAGGAIHADIAWTTVMYIVVFTLGALFFYTLLFRYRLVPRWLSLWGLIAAVLLLLGTIVGMYDLLPLGSMMSTFGALVALNELTLAYWLIVKGIKGKAASLSQS